MFNYILISSIPQFAICYREQSMVIPMVNVKWPQTPEISQCHGIAESNPACGPACRTRAAESIATIKIIRSDYQISFRYCRFVHTEIDLTNNNSENTGSKILDKMCVKPGCEITGAFLTVTPLATSTCACIYTVT